MRRSISKADHDPLTTSSCTFAVDISASLKQAQQPGAIGGLLSARPEYRQAEDLHP